MRTQRKGDTVINVWADDNTTADDIVRLTRLARELRMTDQILSDDLDTVTVSKTGPAPAFTSLEGDHITFALDQMPTPDSRAKVAVWLGTNAHELGHVLFSPRTGSPLMVRVRDDEDSRALFMLHNIVEDQRQERLVLARFAPWRTYLVAALAHHLLVGVDENAWLLFAGRTWLPAEVRVEARRAFAAAHGEAAAETVAQAVGAYQRLTDPGDTEADEAWTLLVTLHNLMPRVPQVRTCGRIANGEPDTSEPGAGAPATADEAEAVEAEGEADTSTEGGEAEGTAQDGQDGAGSGEGGDDKAGEPGGAQGASDAPQMKGETFRRALRQAVGEAVANETHGDLDDVMAALEVGPAGDRPHAVTSAGSFVPVTDGARRLHREIADALLDIKDANEPAWVRRTDSGRLNVARLASPAVDADQLFDRFEAGQLDSNELEVVVLLDVSGSMSNDVNELAEAAWAMRQAVDDLDGTITVFTWSNNHRVMSTPDQRPDGRMFVPRADGGTVPTGALNEAYRLLAGSGATHRLVVVLTDGAWSSTEGPEAVIGAMNQAGVTTVCALLGDIHGDFHGCRFGRRLKALADLPRLFAEVAGGLMAQA